MSSYNKITVGNRTIGGNSPPMVLAEIACSHEGDTELAHKLVDIAADAGAEAIQFQLGSVDRILVPYHPLYKLGLGLQIPYKEWGHIIKHAQEREVLVWANIMDESAVELAVDADVDAVKIHSADLSNPDILDSVASIGKPVSLSVGGSTIDEILQALFTLRRKDVNDIILMHGFQAFPTSIEDSRPNFIRTLIKLFNCPVGYQDHTDGGTDYAYYLPIMAMCAGACILEKHITDDRTLKRVDYESALGPIEFKRFVDMVRRLSTALDGGEVKPLSEPEKKYRKNFKKSIVAACQIEKGKVIKKEMLSFMRTNTDGLPPTKVNTVIGRKCKTNIEQYDILKKNNLE